MEKIMANVLKALLKALGMSAIPVLIEVLKGFVLDSIKNPTSEASKRLYTYLKPVQGLINEVIKKIEDANPTNPEVTLAKWKAEQEQEKRDNG